MIQKFIKKPVTIEAMQFIYSPNRVAELMEFCGSALGSISKERRPAAKAYAEIKTLEDGDSAVKHMATEGDWIIRGIKGEFYPCKPDIFDMTYELVAEGK